LGRDVLAAYGRRAEDLDTVYVIVNYKRKSERLLSRAKAVLYILVELGGVWSLARVFRVLPDFIMNRAYNLLGKIRYRVFGKYDTCLMPRPEHKARFLDV
jgi:predicted DCC family thiol-disulfide oxidoreductase YuxK